VNEDAKRMIEAVHVINNGTFTARTAPSDGAPDEVVALYLMTRREGTGRLKLRNYQRFGISSRVVADALKLGVLSVAIDDSGRPS
jgi:hypothetical protein